MLGTARDIGPRVLDGVDAALVERENADHRPSLYGQTAEERTLAPRRVMAPADTDWTMADVADLGNPWRTLYAPPPALDD